MKWRGGLTLRSLSNHTYNCVGMIFASRRAWIEIDYIEKIFVEDGYHQIQSNDVMIGDVVLYRDTSGQPTHVAQIMANEKIGTSQNIKVLSKWGQLGEFIHFVENVADNLGKPSEFYTERSL